MAGVIAAAELWGRFQSEDQRRDFPPSLFRTDHTNRSAKSPSRPHDSVSLLERTSANPSSRFGGQRRSNIVRSKGRSTSRSTRSCGQHHFTIPGLRGLRSIFLDVWVPSTSTPCFVASVPAASHVWGDLQPACHKFFCQKHCKAESSL